MQHSLSVTSLGISTAFLQGLRFGKLAAKAKDHCYGVNAAWRIRFTSPAILWRHLRAIRKSGIVISDEDIEYSLLELLNALYRLADGPIMFQAISCIS